MMLTHLSVTSRPCLGCRNRGHRSCLRACCNGNDDSVLKGQLTLCSKFFSAAVRSKQAYVPYGLAVLLLLPLISALASAPGSHHCPCGWAVQLLWFVSCGAGHGRCLHSFHHVINMEAKCHCFDLLTCAKMSMGLLGGNQIWCVNIILCIVNRSIEV